MVGQNLLDFEDPTLKALGRAIAEKGNAEPARPRLGASGVGHPCERKSWLQFRWATDRHIEEKGIRAIRSGHTGEEQMIQDLKLLEPLGVQLWTTDEATGKQIGFEDLGGHFGGSVDGVILGLLQAPKTPHVWECKVVNVEKFEKLKKLRSELGEKATLERWDETYYAQAQLYMHYLQLDRHYLTVCTPGLRDVISVRTEYDSEAGIRLQVKAARVIFSNRPPSKISDDAGFYICRFCDFQDLCHGVTFASVNCRTCTHSTALQESEGGGWHCSKFDTALTTDQQRDGCSSHLYHPDLVPGVPVEASEDETTVTYALHSGETWVDGPK